MESSVAIVIPVFNESEIFADVIQEIRDVGEKKTLSKFWEIQTSNGVFTPFFYMISKKIHTGVW